MGSTWKEDYLKLPHSKDVILGYLEAFDPDVLVQLSNTVPDFITRVGLQIIKPNQIWNISEHGIPLTPEFGVGIFELLDGIYIENFKYQSKYPVKVIFPIIPRELALFWVSWFGEMPPAILSVVKRTHFEQLDAEAIRFDVSRLAGWGKDNVLFPRRIVQFGLRNFGPSGSRGNAHVLFLDATKVEDIIDLWNLRALGKYVMPVPKQLQTNTSLNQSVVNFLRVHRRHWEHDRTVCDYASIIPSRNSRPEEVDEYTKTLTIKKDPRDPSSDPYFSTQRSFPKIWGQDRYRWAPHDIFSVEKESIDVSETSDTKIRIRSLAPQFVGKYGFFHGSPRCANEIDFRFYSADDFIAEVFPKFSGKKYAAAISGVSSLKGDWRVGRNGLVKLVSHQFGENRHVPLAENVFFAWLEDQGWHANLSTAGLLAKRIYKILDGWVSVLKSEKLLGLLEHMSGGLVRKDGTPAARTEVQQERELGVSEVKEKLSSESPGDLYDRLVKKGIFKIGVRVQCPHCTRRSWFPLEGVRDTFSCLKCLNYFPAIGNIETAPWCLRSTGPFSVPRYADGAYSVLLTANFFSNRMTAATQYTQVLSFVAESPTKKKIEADVAAFWQETIHSSKTDGLLFAECKTYGRFAPVDYDRMRYLAETFPGAVLVFSTLRRSLTASEKTQISRIAKRGRKHWRENQPVNPVMILTGTELLGHTTPPGCWNDDVKKKVGHIVGLLALCNATQRIYLGLPPWQIDWHTKWERKDRERVMRMERKNRSSEHPISSGQDLP
jgi:hypothetical protein